MPLGKYYCDYCDKEFQDTPFHRKRHIQGIQHQRAKASWYSSIFTQTPPPDSNHISSATPGVCTRFIRTARVDVTEIKMNNRSMCLVSLQGKANVNAIECVIFFHIGLYYLIIFTFLFPSVITDAVDAFSGFLGSLVCCRDPSLVFRAWLIIGGLFHGSCPYGDSCKYFHPSQNTPSNSQGFTVANNMGTHLPSFQMNQPIERSSLPGKFSYNWGMGGVMLGNLPPSLRPPPEGGYPSLPFVDWG
ncbi:zinc finger CCCH domain-containing protein 3 [Artemisia annua]|uniref:Zinc finger CCCH domain-containing protein 3 n=1 Tax=Artemisia annua TaxID=35608 RepID=A0A2U1LEL5_ARTAN|nr:zinc finger CCCH domain-containing protein 3 [Artemisia annua]